ncbi:LysR family transcriptional regulator [Amycolatopsis sp. NPDC089917]|uniref:LysR family transcriptional regulator n=1 Tax=Amycolatopsis sp. NPDC089917 TaxID=3155187 RepID=UPI0034165AB5
MLLRQLEYLVALAKGRHFGRAADACHMSPPSLSAAIRKLERDLGVPIVRSGRRFAGLTPEGERVLLRGHRILAECDALRQDLLEGSAIREEYLAVRTGGKLAGVGAHSCSVSA